MRLIPLLAFSFLGITTWAQGVRWNAFWIEAAATTPQDYGVYHFRHTFDLSAKPEHLLVRVSADNRYQLFVNGELVSVGPARGDLNHWRYEVVDLAPQLKAGTNLLAAVVWNDGPDRAVAQISNRTGFVLAADDPQFAVVNTGRQWLAVRDEAYQPVPLPNAQRTGYYALSPNEKVNARLYPWGWETPQFNDSRWPAAAQITPATERYAQDAPNRWMLTPSELPREERTPDKPFTARIGTLPVTVAAHSQQNILLDLTYETTGYPEMTVNGGEAASVQMRYAESLYVSTAPTDKGDRNSITGKKFVGPADEYILDGASRTFRPLYWRTYRYIQLEITTADEPVTVQSVRSVFTGYPFTRRAEFRYPDDAPVQRILTTGWHTARLCAHETYMDCPFYEQLQYAGDARIQMMVSLFQTGDARLMKNGIGLLNSSRTAEGATFSRAPSSLPQYIPGFSLWWIGMLHDYFWYVDDPQFVREMLPGVRAVLSFFHQYQKENGSLRKLPWWNFVDWAHEWKGGDPPADPDGSSAAASDLQLLLAYDWAADLEGALGDKALAQEDRAAASQIRTTIRSTDWDAARRLFADEPTHTTYSQQTNTLAVLAHVATGEEAKAVVGRMLSDKTLTQSSIYFLAYTNATLREVGLGDRYLDQLGPWRQMLTEGLTTLAEWSGPDTRSDCHAWGASPDFEVLRTIAGIDSAAPSFNKVIIRPNLGALAEIHASMPHPKGVIKVDLKQTSGALRAVIDLPPGIPGVIEWRGVRRTLQSGNNEVTLTPKTGSGEQPE